MNTRQLKEIVVQQREELKEKDRGIERGSLGEIRTYLKIPHAVIISGVRRSGKSTLLTQIISQWFDEKFYYLNFEDERLISFSAEEDFDFVIKEGLHVKELIQVCYSLDEKTEEREVRSLIKAMDAFKLKEGLVITEDLDKEGEVDDKKIMYKPLWKWLLELR